MFSLRLHSQPAKHPASLLFYQLNTSHGLSDNYINDMCTDREGNLWIASGEGLNMFNGKTVVKFFKQEYPQLETDYTRQVVCDDRNRIWVLMNDGFVVMIDEQRKFHRISLYEQDKRLATRRILYVKSRGVVLFTNENHFFLNKETVVTNRDSLGIKDFSVLAIKGFEKMGGQRFRQIAPFDKENYLFVQPDGFYKVNYGTGQVEKKYQLAHIVFLTRFAEDRLLYYDEDTDAVKILQLSTGLPTPFLENVVDQNGKPLSKNISNALKIGPNEFLLTSRTDGLYIYNTENRQLTNHRHNAADPTTLINNAPFVVTMDSSGWV